MDSKEPTSPKTPRRPRPHLSVVTKPPTKPPKTLNELIRQSLPSRLVFSDPLKKRTVRTDSVVIEGNELLYSPDDTPIAQNPSPEPSGPLPGRVDFAPTISAESLNMLASLSHATPPSLTRQESDGLSPSQGPVSAPPPPPYTPHPKSGKLP